jgi:hypothetical protein
VNLTGANLTRTGYTIAGANLTGANFTNANFTEVSLTGKDLTGANLTGANLTGVDLTNANLTGANLTNANTLGANLTGANLTNANLTGVKLIVPGNAIVVLPTRKLVGGYVDWSHTGFAVFTDIAGRTLTYTAPANSDRGGGSVSINPTTGAFTYTPTTNQILNNTSKTPDSFTVIASDGLVTATQSITIPGVFDPSYLFCPACSAVR